MPVASAGSRRWLGPAGSRLDSLPLSIRRKLERWTLERWQDIRTQHDGSSGVRSRPLTAVHRDVAGSIAVSLLTQLGLLVSGVAGARILGVLDRGRSALLLLFASVLPLLATLGVPLALTYWIARRPELMRS